MNSVGPAYRSGFSIADEALAGVYQPAGVRESIKLALCMTMVPP